MTAPIPFSDEDVRIVVRGYLVLRRCPFPCVYVCVAALIECSV